jgi:DeoR/GlpR family transcriptional regulator of sugar metabolism
MSKMVDVKGSIEYFRRRSIHQDLADTLNTTRVTITRTLKQLEDRGSIHRLTKNQIFIASAAESGFDAPLHLAATGDRFSAHR